MTRRRRCALILSGAVLVMVLVVLAFVLWTRHGRGSGAPRIGLSVSNLWYDRMQLHRAPYDLALARAGANVVTIEPQDPSKLDRVLDGVDGLLLAGGGDVDPALFDGETSKAYFVDRERDDFEIALLRRAEARGLPVLAICRGIQILAVAEGGRLRNLESDPKLAGRHRISPRSFAAHAVRIAPGTRLHARLGDGPHTVSSFHIQAVSEPGPRLRVAATADDGVIEAIELPGDRMVVGIQWHPELQAVADDVHMAPFRMLVEEARKRLRRPPR